MARSHFKLNEYLQWVYDIGIAREFLFLTIVLPAMCFKPLSISELLSIRLASSLFKSLRIHLRHSTIRETKLPRPRLPPKRVAAKPSLLLPSQTQKANQRTTTVIPSMAVEDVLLATESELTIVAVEPGVERRSKRYVLNDQLYIPYID